MEENALHEATEPNERAYGLPKNLANYFAYRECNGANKFQTIFPITTSPDKTPINIHPSFKSQVLSNGSFISKLRLAKRLEGHRGCVNTIQWNKTGTLVVTGSDDCKINIYSGIGPAYKRITSLDTCHYRNIFCAKFVPDGTDKKIVSCGMDGSVVLTDIVQEVSSRANSNPMGNYSHMLYKIEFLPNTPEVFLTTHQDGKVRIFDIREKTIYSEDNDKNVFFKVKHANQTISANSLAFAQNGDPTKFVIGGADHFVRLFDLRYIRTGGEGVPLRKFCPGKLANEAANTSSSRAMNYDLFRYYITGVDFNNENEIVATYSREDVYLFSAADGLSESQMENSNNTVPVVKEYKQVYTGRRNVQTFLKEVAFFCDNSFVCTGSDCGNLFIWEKKTGELVNCLNADGSVVNGVAPHPSLPTLATCGIDSDGKIFEIGDKSTFSANYAKKTVDRNKAPARESMSMLHLWDLIRQARSGQIDPSIFQSEDEEEEQEEEDNSISDQEAEQKISQSEAIRTRANDHFKNARYEEAIKDYTEAAQALTFVARSDTIKERQKQARILCILNRAASNLKLNLNDSVIADCDEVLAEQPENIKALVRRGNAYMNKEEYQLAKEDLKLAYRLCPEDAVIKRLLLELKAKHEEQLEREKRAFGGMFK